MRQKYWLPVGLLAIAGVILSAGIQIASAQQTQPPPAPTPVVTRVRIFNAFNSGGGGGGAVHNVGLQINPQVNGTCFATSIADSGRPDAYRCMVGNAIMDPCFGFYAAQNTLLCAEAPWKAAVTPLALSGTAQAIPPNKASDLLKSLPWAIELANGSRCVLITGATGAFAGMRLNYGCEDQGDIIGDPIRDSQTWRVFYQGPKSYFAELTDITVAWY